MTDPTPLTWCCMTRPTGEDEMSNEHVEVLERLRGVLEHGKMGDKCLIAPDLVTAAIAALSAPQPPAEAHEDEVVCLECGQPTMPMGQVCHACSHPVPAPPSAPVGVEGLVVKWKKESESLDIHPAGLAARRVCAIELEHALAQQPAAAGEEIMVNAAHDVYTLPLQPSGLSSGPRFVVHVPAPEQPAAPTLAKYQPCGCVICTFEAEHGGNRADHPPYVVQQPAAVDEAMVGLAKKARELQRRYYGNGIGLHLSMISWAQEYDALAVQQGGAQ